MPGDHTPPPLQTSTYQSDHNTSPGLKGRESIIPLGGRDGKEHAAMFSMTQDVIWLPNMSPPSGVMHQPSIMAKIPIGNLLSARSTSFSNLHIRSSVSNLGIRDKKMLEGHPKRSPSKKTLQTVGFNGSQPVVPNPFDHFMGGGGSCIPDILHTRCLHCDS